MGCLKPNSASPVPGDGAGGSPVDSSASSFATTPEVWKFLSEIKDIDHLRVPLTNVNVAIMEAGATDDEILANAQERCQIRGCA